MQGWDEGGRITFSGIRSQQMTQHDPVWGEGVGPRGDEVLNEKLQRIVVFSLCVEELFNNLWQFEIVSTQHIH